MSNKCPAVEELQAVAAGEVVAVAVQRHVAACETCSQIVASLRRDASLVHDLREAYRDDLDPVTLARLLERCSQAP